MAGIRPLVEQHGREADPAAAGGERGQVSDEPWWDDCELDEDGAVGSFGKVAMSDRALRFERTAFSTEWLCDGRLAPQHGYLASMLFMVLPVASSPKAHARLAQHPRAEVDYV